MIAPSLVSTWPFLLRVEQRRAHHKPIGRCLCASMTGRPRKNNSAAAQRESLVCLRAGQSPMAPQWRARRPVDSAGAPAPITATRRPRQPGGGTLFYLFQCADRIR
jgi:hypothetical protein